MTTTDPLATLLHDSMPDEHNWRLFFGREDDEDGWWLVIKRDLSVYLADRLRAHGVTTDDRLRAVLDDEPMFTPSDTAAARWYSEGWNRCARDVRAALGEKP